MNVWRAWAICTIVGVLLIALPDSDDRIFSFSEEHGPALADLIGTVVLLAGWVLLCGLIWNGRSNLRRAGPQAIGPLIATAIAGLVLLVWSIRNDEGRWWMLGALLIAGAQFAGAVIAGRTGLSDRTGRSRGTSL
ncbi:MAG: hypothetical protein M3164_08430 [Actinomycetota bacterium]|nr:hypothetical protein [Actinomycetota bacterium]